jgi:multimeric flavodoxin WrbA
LYGADRVPVREQNLGARLALIERAGFVFIANNYLLRGKAGAGVVAARRASSIQALTSLTSFLYNQIVIPGSTYWSMGIRMNPGDVQKDRERMQYMIDLGANMVC